MPRHWRETLNLYRGPSDWYKIRNSARGAEITVYDEIGLFGVTAQDFVRDIGNIKGPITLRLNSPGGEVFDGLAIYNALRQRPDVSISVDGIAASIASVISQAASPGKLSIAATGSMMIHDGFSICTGNAQEMRKLADVLDEQSDVIAGVYAQRTGKPASYWRDQMKEETWFTAQKAVDAGLADTVSAGGPPVNQFDLSMFHNAKKKKYDPDNDGDDDSTAAGDTDHDYVKSDGSPGPKAKKKAKKNADGTKKPFPGAAPPFKKKSARSAAAFWNAKYKQADRDAMAKSGQALPDGSYPVADAEDLDNAIKAVGRGGADHDAIRAHIIKRAAALKLSSQIPDNWNADGSLSDASNHIDPRLLQALFTASLRRVS